MKTKQKILELFSHNRGTIPFSFSFGSKKSPHCIIIGALHGNERAGLEVVHAMYENRKHIDGTITAVLGNPKAYNSGVRYIDENLNRIFKDPIEGSSYEAQRAREIEHLFKTIATQSEKVAVIDIHTTSQGEDQVYMCNENDKETLQFIKNLNLFDNVVLISKNLSHSLGELSYRSGFAYIGAECGIHETDQAGDRAVAMTNEALIKLGMSKEERSTTSVNKKTIVRIEKMIPPTAGLRFTVKRKIQTITPVKKDEVYAIDNTERKIAKKDIALFCIPKKVRHTDTNAGFVCSYVE